MIKFPVGFHDFHENKIINVQMNRWYSSGFISYDELMAVGKKIKSFEDWTDEFCTLALDYIFDWVERKRLLYAPPSGIA